MDLWVTSGHPTSDRTREPPRPLPPSGRRGQAVLVRDHDRVIARIEPAGGHGATAGDDAVRLSELEARGILRRGRGRISSDLWTRRPRTDADAIAVLLAERDDGR